MTDIIQTQTSNNITTITLNRPDVHNAFNEDVIAALTTAFETAGNDKNVRAVVLRGNGKSFCAGGDLNWMRKSADYTREQNIEDAMQLGHLLRLIYTLPKVTIALVQGNAFGGGVGLTACCDIAIAEDTARFSLSEVRIGLIPSIIAPYVIASIGERQSRRYFMTAERFGADEAKRIGLVHETVAAGGLDATCDNITAEILQGAPGAQARGKKLLLGIAKAEISDDIVRKTVEEIADARASDEGKEGLSAFLDKKEPSWRKR
ncbi:MAG: enoyl-CoA hydratase/isomerase family protein [Alphaproteobacteria bacterium]|nr:enoyl-CoA hydratase/isomerase family protein [Alphaproteobacteria bacterium]